MLHTAPLEFQRQHEMLPDIANICILRNSICMRRKLAGIFGDLHTVVYNPEFLLADA